MKVGESSEFLVKMRVEWVIETMIAFNNYDASNHSSVLVTLRPPVKRSECKFAKPLLSIHRQLTTLAKESISMYA